MMECEVERLHSSTKAYGSGFIMLSTNLYAVFARYLQEGRIRAPPAKDLEELSPTFQSGARTDRRALQSKFKSWAKRMALVDGRLVLASNGKIIVPRESCEAIVAAFHFMNQERHCSVDEVVTEIQKRYTWSRKNFGMDWYIICSTLSLICNRESCLSNLHDRLYRPTVMQTRMYAQSVLAGEQLFLPNDSETTTERFKNEFPAEMSSDVAENEEEYFDDEGEDDDEENSTPSPVDSDVKENSGLEEETGSSDGKKGESDKLKQSNGDPPSSHKPSPRAEFLANLRLKFVKDCEKIRPKNYLSRGSRKPPPPSDAKQADAVKELTPLHGAEPEKDSVDDEIWRAQRENVRKNLFQTESKAYEDSGRMTFESSPELIVPDVQVSCERRYRNHLEAVLRPASPDRQNFLQHPERTVPEEFAFCLPPTTSMMTGNLVFPTGLYVGPGYASLSSTARMAMDAAEAEHELALATSWAIQHPPSFHGNRGEDVYILPDIITSADNMHGAMDRSYEDAAAAAAATNHDGHNTLTGIRDDGYTMNCMTNHGPCFSNESRAQQLRTVDSLRFSDLQSPTRSARRRGHHKKRNENTTKSKIWRPDPEVMEDKKKAAIVNNRDRRLVGFVTKQKVWRPDPEAMIGKRSHKSSNNNDNKLKNCKFIVVPKSSKGKLLLLNSRYVYADTTACYKKTSFKNYLRRNGPFFGCAAQSMAAAKNGGGTTIRQLLAKNRPLAPKPKVCEMRPGGMEGAKLQLLQGGFLL